LSAKEIERAEGVCPTCDGRQYVYVEEQNGWAPCKACHAEKDLLYRVRRACVPPKYEHCRVKNYNPKNQQQRDAKHAVTQSLNGTSGFGLMFVGMTGLGKTHLAVAALSEHVKRGMYGLFLSAPAFIQELHEEMQFQKDPNYRRREGIGILQEAQGMDILLIDDIGAERVTDYTRDQLHLLLDHRYANELPVIVTSNKETPEALLAHLGPRLYSRLAEMCKVVSVVGGDYRVQEKAAK
jgi:DNA replication protein DnaC